jgi:agmatinase
MSTLPPTFATPPGFLGQGGRDAATRYVVAGVPLDLGTTNRSGAREGPAAIRRASRMLVDGAHPLSGRDPKALGVADIGDLPVAVGDLEASLGRIEAAARDLPHLVALGGDHALTLPLLRALAQRTGPLALVHFDAHLDTWPDSFGAVHGHGSVFFHAINEGLVDPKRMIQIGIRSPADAPVIEWTRSKGVTTLSTEDVHLSSPAAVADRIRQVVGGAPAYLTFDIDALDPSQAPGTGTPEVGGLFAWQALGILNRLQGLRFQGMDVVEVAPAYDVAEVTALAAATIAWTYLALDPAKLSG